VVQTETTFRLTAATKIKLILEENQMQNCNPKMIPFPQNTQVDVRHCPTPETLLKKPFRHVLGQLQYLQCLCRPTIAHNVSQLARVQSNPAKQHWELLMHILKYLAGTVEAGVEYSMQPEATRNKLSAYSDASWADIPGGMGHILVTDGRKSTLGHAIFLNGGPIMWKAHVSKVVALSSAESELFATVACAKAICEARRMMKTLGERQGPTPTTLWCDSSSVVSINSKRNTSTKMRHVEIKYFYCRGLAEAGIISTEKILGEENPADLFTKALGVVKSRKFSAMLEQGAKWLTGAASAACVKSFDYANAFGIQMYDFW
jgi:hypothetical protein